MAKNSNPTSYTGQPSAVPGTPFLHSFPSPNLDDRIFVVRKDIRYGGFRMPDQGDSFTGPQSDKYTDFVFATAKPTDNEGWLDFYYLNERANQDDYNFEVDYPYVDRNYPRYTRTYVVLRDDTRANEPQADAVDPVHTDLLLTDHKWLRLQDPVLDSIFIGIQRTYERLPSPVIISESLNQYQQEVTSAAQEDVDPDFPVVSELTEDVKLERTGTAKAKLTTSTVEELFPDTRYQLEREDRILPFKFRTRNPMETDSHIEAGVAVVPTLGQDDWSAEEHQTTDYKKFVSRSFRSVELPVTLIDYKLDNDQRLVTITDTWDNGLQTITPTTDLVEASVSNLGNDESIQSLSTVDGPFPHGEYTINKPDPLPIKFRVAVPTETTALTSTGTAVMQTLDANELEHKEEQQTAFHKRVTSTERSGVSLPVSLTSYKVTKDIQLETVVETLNTGIQDISPYLNHLLIEGSVENLGNNTSLAMIGYVSELFDEAQGTTSIPEYLPERYRAAIAEETVEHTLAGTATVPPVLTGDQTSKTESQLDEFKYRRKITSRDLGTMPVLQGQDYDQVLDVVLPYLETVEDAGISIGLVRREVTPLGNNKELVKAPDITAIQAILDTYVLSYPGTTNLQLPDVLHGVSAIMESTSGDGFYDETGGAFYIIEGDGGASSSLSIRGTGQASAAIIPDLAIDIEQVWANNVPTTHYLFFLPFPVTKNDVLTKLAALIGDSVEPWPNFHPTAHTFVLTGQRLSMQLTASSNWHRGQSIGEDGGSFEAADSSGTGASNEVGLTVRTVRIPPTIHEALTLEGYGGPVEVQIHADAQAVASNAAIISRDGSVFGSITPTTLEATSGDNTIPTSGIHLLHVDADLYRYGYAKLHAEVLDFSDLLGGGEMMFLPEVESPDTTGAGECHPAPAPMLPVPTYHGNFYIRFWVMFDQDEIDQGGSSAEFMNVLNNNTSLFGIAYDYDAGQWNITGINTEITAAVVANVWYQIDFRVTNNSEGAPVTLRTTINNSYYPDADGVLGTNITVNKIYAGAYNTPMSQTAKRKLFKFLLGTKVTGRDVFDGRMTGSIVPPFDARVGVGVSIEDTYYMNVETASGDSAYAVKTFDDQNF